MSIKNFSNFSSRYGESKTTNFQLIKWAKELRIKPFYYCMRDEIIPTLKNKTKYYAIVNIHTSQQRGVHHSALYQNNEQMYFFDSYGLDPTKEIIDLKTSEANQTTLPLICSTFQIQQLGETNCGQLSLYVLYKLSKGEQFKDIILNLIV